MIAAPRTWRDALRGTSKRQREAILSVCGVSGTPQCPDPLDLPYRPDNGLADGRCNGAFAADEERLSADLVESMVPDAASPTPEEDMEPDPHELAARAIQTLAAIYAKDPMSVAVFLLRVQHPTASVREISEALGVGKTMVADRLQSISTLDPTLARAAYGSALPRARSQARRRARERGDGR